MPLTNFTYGVRGAAPVTLTSSTQTVNPNDHAFRQINLSRAAGITVTLPAATGSGDTYNFFVLTTTTSNGYIVKVANASDIMSGSAVVLQDGGDTMVGFETGATDDTITLNGTTTGGIKGGVVQLVDTAANTWQVLVEGSATGTEATPFSATV